MTVSSIAAEAFFCAGWIAVGAAAAYSRYKKALEAGENARGLSIYGSGRELHGGLYFGRAAIQVEPAAATAAPQPVPMDAPMAQASLISLAKALEEAQANAQPVEEKTPAD